MVELAGLAGVVVLRHGVGKVFVIQPQLMSQFRQRIGLCARKDRRHEVADGFTVDNGVANLPGLLGDQSSPDGVAFGPKIFAFIIKTLSVTVDDYAERNAVHAGTNPAVI